MRVSNLFEFCIVDLSGKGVAYAISHKRNPLDRIPHHGQPRPFQLFRTADIALHIHKRDRQERTILLKATNHALLALGREQEALLADLGQSGYGALDFFLGDQLELVACGWAVGLRDDVDDVKDVEAALGGEVFATEEGGADDDELLAFPGVVFGYCEGHGFDAENCFGGLEVVSGGFVSTVRGITRQVEQDSLINDGPSSTV